MKILLDTCIWGGVKQELLQTGYDVKWVGDFKNDPGDKEIIKIAYQEKRIFITLDKDFGELVVVHGEKHHGIIPCACQVFFA
jgi:predicted nuclease of predicted toxin-antitoxin system